MALMPRSTSETSSLGAKIDSETKRLEDLFLRSVAWNTKWIPVSRK